LKNIEAVAVCEPRLFDLTAQDDQLPAKKSIFYQKLPSASTWIGEGSHSQQDGSWFHPSFYLLLKPIGKRSPDRGGENIHALSGWKKTKIKNHENSRGAKIRILG
jgi:hypothetical protein